MPEEDKKIEQPDIGSETPIVQETAEISATPESDILEPIPQTNTSFEGIKEFDKLKVRKLYAGLPVWTAVPTYAGFQGEYVWVDDTTDKMLYAYINGAWVKVGSDAFGDAADFFNLDGTTAMTGNGDGFKDEDDMASDLDTAVASQQSIKKYVDDSVFDPFKQFLFYLPWENVTDGNGYDTTIAVGGSITAGGGVLEIKTDTTSADVVSIWNLNPLLGNFDKNITVQWTISFVGAAFSDNDFWLLLTKGAASPPTMTKYHIGFHLDDMNIFATSADDTTQETTDTDINISAGAQQTRLKAVFTAGVDVKFYVNDVLKVTHSTKIPAGAAEANQLLVSLRTNESAAKEFEIYPIIMTQDY